MRELPSGTVTLLFTDIEGSTRLLHELGDAYVDVLEEHQRKLRAAFERHGGVEIGTQGDAFFAVFVEAAEAVAAAAEAQTELARGPVRVRMGMHTGTPMRAAGDYTGLDVHLAARISAAGHGGQVLLSQATRALVDGVVRDLGDHRLKDFDEPVRLYQLGDEGYPPLKTVGNTNLPRPASSFVGREREVAEVAALVRAARFVTLTGPGGSGKTRLAIEAAAELVGEFPHGVFWVGLATLRDPELVLPTIAQTLSAQDELLAHIGDKELLLLVDNLEQVVDAARQLAELVEACPNLRLLTTSREVLRVRGEIEYEVEPLAATDAVELFLDRAHLAGSRAIEELCRRLDHMPLALELAAARTRALTPEQILDRLADRLDLLKGGRDAEPRQATLRATIEWSHELLAPDEAELFRRLGVFAGGSTLDAAEAVSGADLDLLQSLVEKSLLRHTEGRYWMLETIRQYAAEQLRASAEADALADRHARWYLEFARVHRTVPTTERLDQVQAELDNLRAARRRFSENGDVEAELQLAEATTGFLDARGYWAEARAAVESALERGVAAPAAARADGWQALAQLAFGAGDFTRSEEAAQHSLALRRELGDDRGAIGALFFLGLAAAERGDYEEASVLAEETRELCRRLGEDTHLAGATANLGLYALLRGNTSEGRALTVEALEAFRALGYERGVGFALENLGVAELLDGHADEAGVLLRQSLERGQEIGSPDGLVNALVGLAGVAVAQGDARNGARLLGAADAIRVEAGRERLEALEVRVLDHARRLAVARLGEDEFAAAWSDGRALSSEDAVALALGT